MDCGEPADPLVTLGSWWYLAMLRTHGLEKRRLARPLGITLGGIAWDNMFMTVHRPRSVAPTTSQSSPSFTNIINVLDVRGGGGGWRPCLDRVGDDAGGVGA